MLSSALNHRTHSHLELSAMYPHCPDDEVREFVYGVRVDKMHALSIARICQQGGCIFVADKARDASLLWSDLKYLVEAVDKMFKCSWPDVFGTKKLQSLDLPASMDKHITILRMGQAARNKAVYEFYPLKTDQRSDSDDALRRFTRALCTTFDVIRCFRQTPWIPMYNSLMASIWHDDLKGRGVSVSFRPRWNLFPGDLGEWPVIVPDVVFSAVVPISNNRRLLDARKSHPGYAFTDPSIPNETLEIPILIVEYDKIDLLQEVPQPPRSEAHLKHLEAAIAAALPMHAALGLKTPVYGRLFGSNTAECYAGILQEIHGITKPILYNISINHDAIFDFSRRRLDILHLCNIIANLGQCTRSILDEIENSDLRPYVGWQAQESFRRAQNRRVIDTKHPPLVAEDETLECIFSCNLNDVQSWVSQARISGADEDSHNTAEPPEEIRVWMSLFTEPERVSQACIQDVVTDSRKGLSDRARALETEFLSGYTHSSPSIIRELSASERASLSFDIQASLTICSHAVDLGGTAANVFHPHSNSSHWSAIYDSIFMRATQQNIDPWVHIQSYPQWKLHRNLRSFSKGMDLEEICPNCALYYCIEEDHHITRHFPADHNVEDVEHLGPELMVDHLARRLSELYNVGIPVMVGEYVLVPGDSDERAKHLAHLAMTMRSALAIWEVHCLKGPVIGFFMERNIVETKLGWIDDDGKCIIRDSWEYRFDLRAPHDTFRLYNFLKVYSSETLAKNLSQKIDAHARKAMYDLLAPSYQSWRQPV